MATESGDDDRALVARHRAGDAAAFDALVRRHQEGVRRLAHRYVRDDEEARDVAQRAFVRAFEKLDQYRGDASFRTWLYRLAVSVALNHVRGGAGRAHEAVPLDDDVAFTNALETSKLVAAELWRKVSERLESLPPRQRLVVELRIFHDLSFDEIGAIVDSSEDAAKANFRHAVVRLRALLPIGSDD